MNTTLKIVGSLVVAGLLFAGCKKSGPVGNYTLDKEEMTKSVRAEIEKLPKEQQGMGELAVAMINMLDIKVAMEEGGKLKMTANKPQLPGMAAEEKAGPETKEGTWKQEGDKITLSVTGEKDLTCTVKGESLECGEGREKIFFKKV